MEGEEGLYFKTSQPQESFSNIVYQPRHHHNISDHDNTFPKPSKTDVFGPRIKEDSREKDGLSGLERDEGRREKEEDCARSRTIPILLDSGKLVSPSFKQLEVILKF